MNQSKKSHTENSNNNNSTAKEELPSSVVSRSFNWLTHKRKSFSLYHFDIMAPPVGIKLKKSKNPKWKVGKKIGAGACASVHELLELDGRKLGETVSSLIASMPTDGFNRSGPLYWLEKNFAREYATHLRLDGGLFKAVVRLPKSETAETIELQPISKKDAKRRRHRPKAKGRKSYSMKLHPEISLAFIEVRTFSARKFKRFLRKSFQQLSE